MKTLITGGNGFVGSSLARKLVEAGEEVRVTIRRGSNTRNLDNLGVEKVYADIRDEAAIDSALKGCRRLYHTAALYKVWLPDEKELHQVNIEGTRTVLGTALRQGVEKVVFTSSIAALGITDNGEPSDEEVTFNLWDTKLPYEISKYESEKVAWDFFNQGLPLVVVRPSLVLGDRDIYPTPSGQLVLDVLHGRYLFYLEGGINIVDINDVTAGHIAAMERGETEKATTWGITITIYLYVNFLDSSERSVVLQPPDSRSLIQPLWPMQSLLLMANYITHSHPFLLRGRSRSCTYLQKDGLNKGNPGTGTPPNPLKGNHQENDCTGIVKTDTGTKNKAKGPVDDS